MAEVNGGGSHAVAVIEDVSIVTGRDMIQNPPIDILEIADPPKQMKVEMRMATKPPSEWLRLLCRDWAQENEDILSSMDERFIRYKSYLKGQLTSQLLCRLSTSTREGRDAHRAGMEADPTNAAPPSIDFWKILGVEDEFDRAHIVANVERFCSLYNIRGGSPDEMVASNDFVYGGSHSTNFYMDQSGMPLDSAAAELAVNGLSGAQVLYHIDPNGLIQARHGKVQQSATKNEMRRIKAETREREREEYSIRKAAEKAARDATREDRRQRKLAMKKQREDYAQRQKEAALQRAAELVQSNRVPIEITRGHRAAMAAAGTVVENAPLPAAEASSNEPVVMASPEPPPKKMRSSIVISTASDLDQIVTHSNNLWAKYNAIAKEHNQKVNWVVVAKELGIHVKVREKYARMHSRAKARGFDFVNWGHYRIKDYPQYFIDPLGPEQEANAIEAPGAVQIAFRESVQVLERPAIGAEVNGVTNHDAICLAAEAAEIAADSMGSDVIHVVAEIKAGTVDSALPLLTNLQLPRLAAVEDAHMASLPV
ncbi:hypothetical protein ACHAW6_008414 [Cyclotella cf. meneghiniana]